MTDADSELVARCAAGDMSALEMLYRRHCDRVWRYAWFRTHSREAAADIVQDTFVQVARSIRSFEGRSAFSTWLFAVARSAAVQYARRQKRENNAARDPQVLRFVPTAELAARPDRLSEAETREAVREAVAGLPGSQRDALVLCELAGLRIREAAEVLGWTEARVKTTVFRARRALRERLKDFVSEQPGENRLESRFHKESRSHKGL
jgi:RNA polymerase sigma-70 factor (ECF subfamily)